MTTLSALKKSSASIDRLAKEIDKLNNPNAEYAQQEDTRFWYPAVDKAGNGQAIFRFLPAPAVDGDDALPWVRLFSHGFQGPAGKWYIENSLTTLGQKDPVSELNTKLWNQSADDESPSRKQARAQKRKLVYISNVLVISDPANPENEGKVFLYRYGKKIFDKITTAMKPEFAGDKPINPFDFWTGANFRLKIRNVAGYRNYDASTFESPSAVADTDEEIEALWNREHSLKEFVAADKFKSYDELKKRLDEVLGLDSSALAARVTAPAPVSKPIEDSIPWGGGDDEDDSLKYFSKFAEEE